MAPILHVYNNASSSTLPEKFYKKVSFTSASVSPLLIRSVQAGESIEEVVIVIGTGFDINIALGTLALPESLIPYTGCTPGVIGTYIYYPYTNYAVATDVYITYSGVPTVGSGTIYLTI